MRDINKPFVPCLLSAAALLGCGGVQTASGTPIDTAPAEIARTICPKAYSCCTAAQLAGNSQLAGSTESECETKTAMHYAGDIEIIKASEQAGRSKYNGDKLAQCLATVRSSTCEQLNATYHFVGVPGCDSFVTPLAAMGGACTNTFECIQGWCRPPENMSGGEGSCEIPQDGEACATSDPKCAPGFNCDTTTNKCVQAQADGSPCTSGLQCQSGVCSSSTPGSTCSPRPASCFYSSGCSVSDGGCPTLPSLLGLAVLFSLALRRRLRRS